MGNTCEHQKPTGKKTSRSSSTSSDADRTKPSEAGKDKKTGKKVTKSKAASGRKKADDEVKDDSETPQEEPKGETTAPCPINDLWTEQLEDILSHLGVEIWFETVCHVCARWRFVVVQLCRRYIKGLCIDKKYCQIIFHTVPPFCEGSEYSYSFNHHWELFFYRNSPHRLVFGLTDGACRSIVQNAPNEATTRYVLPLKVEESKPNLCIFLVAFSGKMFEQLHLAYLTDDVTYKKLTLALIGAAIKHKANLKSVQMERNALNQLQEHCEPCFTKMLKRLTHLDELIATIGEAWLDPFYSGPNPTANNIVSKMLVTRCWIKKIALENVLLTQDAIDQLARLKLQRFSYMLSVSEKSNPIMQIELFFTCFENLVELKLSILLLKKNYGKRFKDFLGQVNSMPCLKSFWLGFQDPLLDEGPLLQGPMLKQPLLEDPKLEGQKLEGQKLEGQKLEDPKLEGQKLEGQLLKDPLLREEDDEDGCISGKIIAEQLNQGFTQLKCLTLESIRYSELVAFSRKMCFLDNVANKLEYLGFQLKVDPTDCDGDYMTLSCGNLLESISPKKRMKALRSLVIYAKDIYENCQVPTFVAKFCPNLTYLRYVEFENCSFLPCLDDLYHALHICNNADDENPPINRRPASNRTLLVQVLRDKIDEQPEEMQNNCGLRISTAGSYYMIEIDRFCTK